ncbi:MAG: pyrroline-5-carboxylate reductase [Oscillospiraceae bacterium]|nr:pyrroline-5-carboxylate reductase [Oscillospiraceae bacterium]
MKINKKIAFIGVGFMAGAMVDGILASGLSDGDNIYCINDAFPEIAREAAEKHGITLGSASDIAECDIVVFGVKPQIFPDALEMYGKYFTSDKLYLSIMAGVSVETLEKSLGGARVVRFMPNMPLSVCKSATVYVLGNACTEAEAELAEAIFAPLGVIKRIDEDMMSAYIALSGSSPAYFCRMIEAVAGAAVEFGVPADVAEKYAVQSFIGTAKVLSETGISPSELRTRVTSKKGTTEAALNSLTESNFEDTVKKCMIACAKRNDELAGK